MVFRLITVNRKDRPSKITSINLQMNWYHQFQMDANPMDIENHADTHGFGQNFPPIHWNETIFTSHHFFLNIMTPIMWNFVFQSLNRQLTGKKLTYYHLVKVYGPLTVWSAPLPTLTNVDILECKYMIIQLTQTEIWGFTLRICSYNLEWMDW